MTWNFDISSIPRGRQEARTRRVKDEIKEYLEFVPVKLWLAHPTDAKVYATYWIEGTKTSKGRWVGWCEGQEPIAWMLFEKPEHPFAGRTVPFTKHDLDPGAAAALLPIIEDCGSGA
jgi:hypothetical protein